MFHRGAGTVQQAVERLNEASSNLSSLLDRPIPRIVDPDLWDREYSGEAEVNKRRAKRRKLDISGQLSPSYRGFSYGHRGQVVPGPLKMEIVSCDGGVHAHGSEHFPENILRNDKSVYCIQGTKCNIVLRHQGETAFCLKKLIIKAPESGLFTAPIQEGMVFVSMEQKDLLARTSVYRLREDSPLSPPPAYHRDPGLIEDLPVLDLDSGELLSEDTRPSSRRRDNNTSGRNIPPPVSDARSAPPPNSYARPSSRAQHLFRNVHRGITVLPQINTPAVGNPLGANVEGVPQEPRAVPDPPTFNVTTDCSDPSSDEEEPSSAATLADLHRRNRASLYAEDSDPESGSDPEIARVINGRARALGVRISRPMRNESRRELPSRIEIAEDGEGSETGDGDAGSPFTVSGASERVEREQVRREKGVLAPHARFFIEKERSCVTINFDPPVTGRFILLKLWSTPKVHNIDIQTIVVHGFAGPRFFPAAKPL